jgi:23S rRNA pseudouridine1911/1915/1917 synthase
MKLTDKDILYLDNHLIVIDKPPLLLTQPAGGVFDSVQSRGQEYIKEKFYKPGDVFLHPVHRLDRVASGIVVSARTSKALSRLNEQIKKDQWKKIYLLRHEGELPTLEGELVHYLVKGDFKTAIFDKEVPGSKKAHLRYKDLGGGLAEVTLFTGRYHQIRAQFSHIGAPICGDAKYGSKEKGISPGIDLHHTHVEFFHPITKEKISITCFPSF